MDTFTYIVILLAIFITAYAVTEVFEIKARKSEGDDAFQTQELEDLKERVATLD